MSQQYAVACQRFDKGCRGRFFIGLQRLAELLLVGVTNLLVVVGFHLAEPVGVSRFARRVLHCHASAPFRFRRLPEVGNRAGGVTFGVIGEHVGANTMVSGFWLRAAMLPLRSSGTQLCT